MYNSKFIGSLLDQIELHINSKGLVCNYKEHNFSPLHKEDGEEIIDHITDIEHISYNSLTKQAADACAEKAKSINNSIQCYFDTEHLS